MFWLCQFFACLVQLTFSLPMVLLTASMCICGAADLLLTGNNLSRVCAGAQMAPQS